MQDKAASQFVIFVDNEDYGSFCIDFGWGGKKKLFSFHLKRQRCAKVILVDLVRSRSAGFWCWRVLDRMRRDF
ncbi:hypothetical protein T10_1255 [Trichinella papuae]|uniref:Uncharacterized protein n=1 Tax=Trichinella papuae TaxID=268474 RepID=A0A0V1M6J1_9BILA|nr:hypothetical protein T10_1255 [Trichinella papuae]